MERQQIVEGERQGRNQWPDLLVCVLPGVRWKTSDMLRFTTVDE